MKRQALHDTPRAQAVLRRLHQHGSMSVTALAVALGVEHSNVSQIVGLLVQTKLAAREGGSHRAPVVLTERGKAIAAALPPETARRLPVVTGHMKARKGAIEQRSADQRLDCAWLDRCRDAYARARSGPGRCPRGCSAYQRAEGRAFRVEDFTSSGMSAGAVESRPKSHGRRAA